MLVEYAAQWTWQAMGGTRIDVLCTFLVFFGALLAARCLQWVKYVRSLPPGPWGVPVFGYLPFLKGDVHLQYGELAKRYGPMFSARLGTQLVVVLSDHRTIRDTFRREEFTGRPHTEFINILGGYGIINTEGAMWKEQRKFLHDKLRSFGMTYTSGGKKVMESRIMREVKTFLRGLASRRGAPMDVSASLGMSVSNVICSILMGVRFQHGDTRFSRFMHLIEEGFKLFGSMAAVNFIPVMRYLPCLQKVRNKLSENRAEMADFYQEAVDQHRATFDEGTVRDLVDTYLLEIEKAKGEGRAAMLFQGKNHDRQMQQILGDLFSAGMETIKTTLEWAIVLMLHHPEAATAVREELDQVVGDCRLPALKDLPFLPITEATILEVLRRSSVVPLGTTHATTRDVTLDGYTIPAGSQVVPLLHAVHMDSKLWEAPEEFRPSRFLSAEGMPPGRSVSAVPNDPDEKYPRPREATEKLFTLRGAKSRRATMLYDALRCSTMLYDDECWFEIRVRADRLGRIDRRWTERTFERGPPGQARSANTFEDAERFDFEFRISTDIDSIAVRFGETNRLVPRQDVANECTYTE